MYDIDYLMTHDIDWFFYAEPYMIHAASNQGILPTELEEERNIMCQNWVSHLPDINEDHEIEVNIDYIKKRLEGVDSLNNAVENYKRTFVSMAKKGFISFDRDIDNYDECIWIARPKNLIGGNSVPSFVFKLPNIVQQQFNKFKIINNEIKIESIV